MYETGWVKEVGREMRSHCEGHKGGYSFSRLLSGVPVKCLQEVWQLILHKKWLELMKIGGLVKQMKLLVLVPEDDKCSNNDICLWSDLLYLP